MSTGCGWICESGGGQPARVYPIGDIKDHVVHGGECWCGAAENEDGTIVHNAMDEREKYEAGERKPS